MQNNQSATLNRYLTIDIAKGLGILLVVLGHNWIVAHEHGELFRVIFSFHMPLFFVLSGVVLKEHGRLDQFILTRADAILKPYIIVLLCWGLLRIGFSGVSWSAYLSGLIYATGFTIEWVPLWYLPHLFISLLCAFVVLRVAGGLHRSILVRVCFLIFLLMTGVALMHTAWPFTSETVQHWNRLLNNQQNQFPGLPWSIDLIGVSCAFILAGAFFKEQIIHVRFHRIYFWSALGCFFFLHVVFNETMDLHMRYYGQFWIVTAQAVLGIYLMLVLSFLLQRCHTVAKIFAYIGESTLMILIFHSWIEWKIFALCGKYLQSEYLSAVISLIAGVILPLLLQRIVSQVPFLARCLLPSAKRNMPQVVLVNRVGK